MSWRRGFFRLWVLIAGLWFAGVAVNLGPEAWQKWNSRGVMFLIDIDGVRNVIKTNRKFLTLSPAQQKKDIQEIVTQVRSTLGSTNSAQSDAKFEMAIPVECANARGRKGELKEKDDYEQIDAMCWYALSTLRRLFSEYNDMSDENLTVNIYARADRSEFFPYLQCFIFLAVLAPLVVLGLGAALAWALRGFQSTA
jgi:hypothetical protein